MAGLLDYGGSGPNLSDAVLQAIVNKMLGGKQLRLGDLVDASYGLGTGVLQSILPLFQKDASMLTDFMSTGELPSALTAPFQAQNAAETQKQIARNTELYGGQGGVNAQANVAAQNQEGQRMGSFLSSLYPGFFNAAMGFPQSALGTALQSWGLGAQTRLAKNAQDNAPSGGGLFGGLFG